MTPRTTDNIAFWRLVQQQLRAGTKDYLGDRPCLPTAALIAVCNRIFNKTNP